MKKIIVFVLALFAITGLFAQERIAVFPFEDRDNLYTIDQLDLYYREFSSEFKNKTDESRFTVISRVDVEKIIDMEHKFQRSDYSSEAKTAELKRVLNPQQVLYILIVKEANNIRINVSRLSFPEMEVLRGGRGITLTNKNQILEKIPELVRIVVNEMAGGTTPAQTYKIGDTGPAGGYIFYDKGNNADGWRYLEAAPAETEFSAQWGPFNVYRGTRKEVGSGKRNTELIVERLKELRENGKAAQLCVNLNFNGYKDWFLPSIDELDLMYKNLAQKGLGRFSGNFYWSSTEAADKENEGQSGTAYSYGFDGRGWLYLNTWGECPVRAVRAFAGSDTSPVTTIQSTVKTYKIGDTGPAGGIIFFDRGFTGDGWRYLEAAPAGAEFTAQWGAYERNVANTMTAVGFGKQNTQIIVDRLRGLRETNRAAQICAALDINGYKDWFLPSHDELNLMYTNLKQKGLGGFGNDGYWSSSQDSNDRAWLQRISDGFQYSSLKFNAYSVRAVRAF